MMNVADQSDSFLTSETIHLHSILGFILGSCVVSLMVSLDICP